MIHGIKSYFGGLGDTLQFSTLPEMFHEKGHQIFLTEDAPFRSKNTRSLIWDLNPYIKGEANVDWTLGDIPDRIYENKHDDFIKNWESIHGLVPKNSFPKIYYSPKNNICNIETLIDLGSITVPYDINNVANYIKTNFSNIKLIINPNNKIHNFGFETLEVDSLKEYVDLINCCKTFISLNSGPHMLAGSIRHLNNSFKQICIMSSYSYNNTNESWHDYQMRTKFFVLPLVNYIKI
jgi:hypothetical protein